MDNMFISGGENVQPEEIEEALRRVEGVEEAVVVPVPDEEFGERPVAFVEKRAGAGDADLAGALEPVLPRFKIPTAFHAWPASADPGRMKIDRAFFRTEALRMHGGKNGYSTDQNH
jgi:O-succinylbenzoic acid--CoA ligase